MPLNAFALNSAPRENRALLGATAAARADALPAVLWGRYVLAASVRAVAATSGVPAAVRAMFGLLAEGRAAANAVPAAQRGFDSAARARAVADNLSVIRARWDWPGELLAYAAANEPYALVNADRRALDGRGFDVPLQIRGFEVPAQQRELAVATQTRVLPLPGQDRTLEVTP